MIERIKQRLFGRFRDLQSVEFLPDADAIEQRPLDGAGQWTLYALALVALAFIIWAAIARVDEIVVGRGKLVTSTPNLMVQPMETAIVQSIDVRIGQIVKKGQRLAALDPGFIEADVSQLRGRFSSLDARTERLEVELKLRNAGKRKSTGTSDQNLQSEIRDSREASFRLRMLRFEETLGKLRTSLNTSQNDQKSLTIRVRSLKEIEQMQERLVAQNFGARQRYLEAQDRRLEVERELDLAKNREAEIRREIAAEEADRDAYAKEWRQRTMEELALVRDERNQIGDQLQKAEKRQSLINLEAPVDAIVLDIAKRAAGSIVREAEPLFTLVPLDVPLELELQINASEVGYVKIGDDARIKLDAFPFQKHGTLTATIKVISEDAFSREPSARQAGQTSDAYYLARGALDSYILKNVGKDFRLFPGLTVSAEIKVGERSVLSYLMYPLVRALDEAIREPR